MMYSINSKQGYLTIFAFVFACMIGVLGAYSPVYSIGLLIVFISIVYYAFYSSKIFWHFLFIIPFIPNYFSFKVTSSLPLVSAFRVVLLFFIVDQLLFKRRLPLLINTIKQDKFNVIVTIYSLCAFVLGLLKLSTGNNTAFIGSVSLLLENILFYYLIQMNIRIEIQKHGEKLLKQFLDIMCLSAFVLSILGIIEFVTSFNIFTLLNTSNVLGVGSSTYFRAGSLRVSTSFPHALGYGMYLLLIIPLVYVQWKRYKSSYYLMLLILLLVNVLLTGSRSTILALGLSFVTYFLVINLKQKLILFYSVFFLGIPLLLFCLTPGANEIPGVSIISKNVQSVSDAVFGTSYVKDFGMNAEPFSYRQQLINYAFSQTGSNDIIGKGIGFIRTEPLVFNIPELNPYGPTISYSVDNYYINVKLEQGWIGLISTLLFLSFVLFKMFKNRKRHPLFAMMIVGLVGYLFELTMVNDLGTIKYFWILLALFSSCLIFLNEKQLPD